MRVTTTSTTRTWPGPTGCGTPCAAGGRHRSLLITGVTNAANTGITNVKRTARGFRNERCPYHSHECCSKRSMNTHHRKSTFTRNREEPGIHAVQRRPQPRDS